MKATDLMIGDWVYAHHPSQEAQPVKVDAGLLGLMERMLIGFVKRESPLFRIVSAIPLTPEILKKNGWSYENCNIETENEEEYFINDGFDIHINGRKLEIRCIDAVNIQLKYVHELQHALRLCGIDKEIVL